MKWLHISDLHYSPENNGAESDTILVSFLKKIQEIQNIDALFITGDFRAGYDALAAISKDQTTKLIADIAHLIMRIAANCNVQKNRIFLVPGNHDYIKTPDPLSCSFNESEGTFNGKDISILNHRFDFFWKLYHQVKGTDPGFDKCKTVCWCETINDLSIISLNTAIADDINQQGVNYGSYYLQQIADQIGKEITQIYILAHHSLQRLSETERSQTNAIIDQLLQQGKKILWLCGHNHLVKNQNHQTNFNEIAAGALKGRYGNHISFTIGDTQTQNETATFFEYLHTAKKWHHTEQRLFSQSNFSEIDLYNKLKCQQQQFSDKLNSLDLTLFKCLPVREKYPSPENQNSSNLISLSRLDKNFAIIGVSGIGKTSFLLHLWDQLLKNEYTSPSLFIPCRDLPDSNTPIATYVTTTYMYSIERNLTLLIDAVNEYRYSLDTLITELQQYIEKPGVRLILSSTSDFFSQRDKLYRSLAIYEIAQFSKEFITKHILNLKLTDELISILSTPLLLCLYKKNTAVLKADRFLQRNIAKVDVRENRTSMDLFHNNMILKILEDIDKVNSLDEQRQVAYKRYLSLFWFYPFISNKMKDTFSIQSDSIENNFLEYFNGVSRFAEEDFKHTYISDNLTIDTHVTPSLVNTWIQEGLFCKREPGTISIIHQEYRDFFAAIFYKNCLLAIPQTSDDCSLSPLNAIFIDDHLAKRLGEYFAQRWKDRYSNKFNQFFTLYRRKRHAGGFLLSNLINILKHISYKPLENFDFSDIDLSHVLLNGITLSNKRNEKASNFSRSTVSYNTIMPQGHSGDVYCVRYAPDGHHFLSASYDGDIRIWDRISGECKQILRGHKGFVHQAVYSWDGSKIASCARDGKVILWDSNDGKILDTHTYHNTAVRTVFFSYDGSKLLSSSENGSIIVYDINHKSVNSYPIPDQTVYCAIFNNAENKILACTNRGNIFVFDVANLLKPIIIPTRDSKSIRYLCSHPDNEEYFFACSADGSILQFHRLEGKYQVSEIGKSTNDVVYIEYGIDENTLLASCHDGSISLWNFAKREIEMSYKFEARALCATFSKDKHFILASFDNGDIEEINLKRLNSHRLHKGQMRSILNFSFNIDSSVIYIPSQDGSIYYADVNRGRPIKLNNAVRHKNAATFVKYISSRNVLISGSYDGTAILWDATSGELIRKYSNHNQPIMCIDYDPQSKTFLTASYDRRVCEWNIDDSTVPIHIYEGATRAIRYAIYCANFKAIAAGSYDKNIYIFDRKNFNKPFHVLEGHTGLVLCLDTTPDGDILFSGSDDNCIREWDINSGKCIRSYSDASCVFAIKFDAERDIILAALYNGSIVEWKRGETANPIFTCDLFSSPATFTNFVNDSDNIVIYASSYQGSLKKIIRSQSDPYTIKEIQHVLTLFSGLSLDGCNFKDAIIDDKHTYDILCQNGAINMPPFR